MTASGARLVAVCKEIGVTADPAWWPKVALHLTLLAKWADKINLTSVSNPDEALVRHVVDSLSLLKLARVRSSAGPWLDVGSGAGFPGIPLAVARPDVDITLLEPRQKRGVFLGRVLAEAGVKNARWLEGRLPNPALAGRFEVVMSRATLAPHELAPAALPVLRPGGAVVVMAAEAPWEHPPAGFLMEEAHAFVLGGVPRWVATLTPVG